MHFFVVKLFKKYFVPINTSKIIGAIILLSISIPACHLKKNKKLIHAQISPTPTFVCHQLAIEGIECKECIRSIIRDLNKSKLCAYIECRCPKKDVSCALINCFVEQEQIFPVQKIKELVTCEHFRLVSTTGTYHGIISEKDEKLVFTPQNTALSLELLFDAHYHKQLLKPSITSVALYGTINLDKNIFIVREKPPKISIKSP